MAPEACPGRPAGRLGSRTPKRLAPPRSKASTRGCEFESLQNKLDLLATELYSQRCLLLFSPPPPRAARRNSPEGISSGGDSGESRKAHRYTHHSYFRLYFVRNPPRAPLRGAIKKKRGRETMKRRPRRSANDMVQFKVRKLQLFVKEVRRFRDESHKTTKDHIKQRKKNLRMTR